MSLPMITLGDYRLTRLMVGGNPFCGNSHFSEEMSRDMREYYTAERVVEVLHRCQASGINTVQARGDYHRILHWLELFRREGGMLHWIAQTASEMHDVFQNIRIIASAGAIGIYHHGSRTDQLWNLGEIDRAKDYLQCIRDTGVLVGLGTHIPEVIEYSGEKGWDVDFYMACFYNLGRTPRESALVAPDSSPVDQEPFLPEDPPRMCDVIRKTSKPCLAFKILGAHRRCGSQEEIREAFRFAFEHIKPMDAVVVGMFPRYEDQITLNVQHVIEVTKGL